MRIAIIGAGFAGLAAAWDLAGENHDVTLFDALDRPGGLASGFRDDQWEWELEHYYHHLFLSDSAILGLAEEIGFKGDIHIHRPVSASFWHGHAWPLDGPLAILRFPAMPFPDRVRMGAVGAWLKLVRDWRPLERVAAHEWLPRWMGPRAYEAVWEPLLLGKFGPEYYRDVPMSWLWARLRARTFRLAYPVGGFQAFADHLAEAVASRGAILRMATPVTEIAPLEEGGLRLVTGHPATPETQTFDCVICTAGPGLLARMTPQLPPDYLERLRDLNHLGAVVVVLALRRSLLVDGTYWLNMDKREFPFLAVVEHTNLMSPAHYGGDHLVYIGDYLAPDHRYFGLDIDELLAEWLPALQRINPAFEPSWLRRAWLSRTTYAQPVVPQGFSSAVPPLATPLEGLYLASMSQVYPWDRGTNFAVEIGRRVASEVLGPVMP